MFAQYILILVLMQVLAVIRAVGLDRLDLERILVLEKGHVEEDGTHEKLFVREGRYYQLWMQNVDCIRNVRAFAVK